VIRTSGLQFATERGLETLEKYYERGQNSIEKADVVPFLQDIGKE